jgi:GDP-L-fucose synthase
LENVVAVGRVLVTGASGVVGRAVAEDLAENDWEVIPVSTAQVDLQDDKATLALFEEIQPEYVIHLAARVHGLMGNLAHPGEVFLENVRLNTNVIEAARRVGVKRFVAMGSVAMYSDGLPLPVKESDMWLGEPHHSEAAYAQAKRTMLAQLDAYKKQYDFDFTLAVATNMFGPGDKFDEAQGHVLPSLISKFYRGANEGAPVTAWGTGTAQRDFLYSKDAASGLRTLLTAPGGVYNLATGVEVSIKNVVEALTEVSGFTGDVSWDATKPDGQRRRLYDVSRLTALGWKPQHRLIDALAESYEWYSTNVAIARR